MRERTVRAPEVPDEKVERAINFQELLRVSVTFDDSLIFLMLWLSVKSQIGENWKFMMSVCENP